MYIVYSPHKDMQHVYIYYVYISSNISSYSTGKFTLTVQERMVSLDMMGFQFSPPPLKPLNTIESTVRVLNCTPTHMIVRERRQPLGQLLLFFFSSFASENKNQFC